jgi:site-specific DNA-methyltransferase (adenine-specific)
MEDKKLNEYIEIAVDELIPYKNNARTHSEEQVEKIAASIDEFGFINPVLIDKDNVIIAGHGRVMGAKKLGLEKVPCLRIEHLTEAQKRAYILADNKLAEDAGWDEEILNIELQALREMDFDISLAGFDLDDLSFDEYGEDEAIEDDYDEELPEEPKSKVGQIYKLGRHRLMCGDSTSVEDVEKLMDGSFADLLLTDPPYNVDYTGKTKDALKIQNDKMDNDNFRQFLRDAFAAADAVMKAGAVFYIWHADSEGYNFRGACFDIGWSVRQCIIWNKNCMVMGRQDYQWKHEPCLYGWKEGAGHLWASDRKQTTVLNFDKPTKNNIHPTMKPIPLFDYQIKNNTKGGDIVLDLFGGSGTTLMACEQNGRNAYLMELDPRYIDAIIDRWEQFTGQKAELISE